MEEVVMVEAAEEEGEEAVEEVRQGLNSNSLMQGR